uniref:ankyrin repeat and protein kinase domain-containing protein 1-like isoform X1 n=1 Tax=Styela clava TaxID=7725 RepID=UPI00193A6629|nr:ankyrin repeat and protein kinase domain-containing protein 1-like isoform X1 [Styela clava]
MDSANGNHETGIKIINSNEMEFVQYLASGGMAAVSLYKWKRKTSTEIFVAMKSLLHGHIENRFKPHLRREMAILATLEHENIVQIFGVVQTSDKFGLVMEYFPFGSYLSFFGSLWDEFEKNAIIEKLIVPIKIQILCEIISAMKYLHGIRPRKVLHLDLKSDNVLLDDSLHAKICDFGLSTMSTLTDLRSRSIIIEGPGATGGTPGYISPERLRNVRAKPTTKADVFSFGVVMWEIMTDKLPYSEPVTSDYHSDDSDKQRPDLSLLPNVFPSEMTSMIQSAWASDPKARPSFRELDEEMLSIKARIPCYKHQVKESRIQTLQLYKSTRAGSDGNTQHQSVSSQSSNMQHHGQSICTTGYAEGSQGTKSSAKPQHIRSPDTRNLSKRIFNGTTPQRFVGARGDEENSPLLSSSTNTSRHNSDSSFEPRTIRFINNDAGFAGLSPLKLLFVIVLLTCVIIGLSVGIWTSTKPPAPNYKCTSKSGTCLNWYEHTCVAGYRSGLCSGDSSIQCCLPCDTDCQKTEAGYNDTACDSIHGICKDKSNYCSQQYIKGKCPGPGDRQCCPPNPADKKCTEREGKCINWTDYKCIAGYRSGLCTGDSVIRCCLACDAQCKAAEDAYKDPGCDSLKGTCMDKTNYCPTEYLDGKCAGPNTRLCCHSYRPKWLI